MSFKDYSPVPASNTTIGDSIFIGPNMERAKVRPALQQLAADGREVWDRLDEQIASLGSTFFNAIVAAGYSVLAEVKVATTDNITLSGTQTIDEIAVEAGDRVLVKDQSIGGANGIYIAAAGAWSRASDFDQTTEVVQGSYVRVTNGATQAGSWVLVTGNPVSVGATAQVWNRFDTDTLASLGLSSGAGKVGSLALGVAAIDRTVEAMLRDNVINARDYGATGDGTTDDTAAIQAALDYAGTAGGAAFVRLPRTSGGYRITAGLKLPSYVGLIGDSPSRYPFAAGNSNTSRLIADFSSANQWVIEPKTTLSSSAIAYNVMLTALPDGATYNCAVRDLIITSTGTLPYGGIRMHGCPGATVSNVAVYNVGCGLLVNECYGGEFVGQFTTAYYGVAVWQDANANRLDVYCARHTDYTSTVPAGYLMPFLSSLSSTLTTTYKFSTNAHYNRAWGLIIGASAGATSANNRGHATVERYSGAVLLLNSYSTSFGGLYIEGDTNVVNTGIAASNCTFSVAGLHSFQSGTGNLFDFGEAVSCDIRINGSAYASAFGKLPEATGAVSKVLLRGVKPPLLSAANQFNVRFPDWDGDWVTPSLSGASNVGTPYNDFAYCINSEGKVEFKGGLTGISGTPTVFTLPAGFRPYATTQFTGVGGTFSVAANGAVTVTSGSTVFFDNCAFKQVN